MYDRNTSISGSGTAEKVFRAFESAKKGISTTYNSTVDDFSFSKGLVLQINQLIFKKRGIF